MKTCKIYSLLLLFLLVNAKLSTAKGIQYGASIGVLGNHNYFIGGSEQAHANFHHNVFGTASLNFSARYFLNEKWSLQSGLGFTELGFESGFTQNYSLVKNDHFVLNRQTLPITQIPLLAVYSFKPDCKNRNWFIGAGFNFLFLGKTNTEITFPAQPGDELNLLPEVSDYSSQLNLNKKSTPSALFLAGREKKFSKGSRLSLAFIYNVGLVGTMATSSINYKIQNTAYNHIFSNRGDYAGLLFTWYFAGKKSKRQAQTLPQEQSF